MAETKKFTITVNETYCKGCGYCIEICPKNVYEFAGKLNAAGYTVTCAARQEDCIGCNSCVMVCPDFALTLNE